jgi:hypothetical protein
VTRRRCSPARPLLGLPLHQGHEQEPTNAATSVPD